MYERGLMCGFITSFVGFTRTMPGTKNMFLIKMKEVISFI